MAREFAITLYLLVFRLLFNIFKLFPQKKKTTFVTSFGDNVLCIINELEKQTNDDVVILKAHQCRVAFDTTSKRTVLLFEPSNVSNWICSIYHLATSRMVFIDNYFGFLAVSNFKPNVTCVQLWHAAGAIKLFGLKDPSNGGRSKRAKERFKRVYNRFNYVVVGSEKMVRIFQEGFGLGNTRMLRTGIPSTDLFYQLSTMDKVLIHFEKIYPLIHQKKVILYAPTFRDDSLNSAAIALDVSQLYEEFKDDYILLLRLHPAIRGAFVNYFPDFIVDVSNYPDIHHLLIVTDLLITDYSSISFEFSLFSKPIIFFAYDLEDYIATRGIWEDYESLVPGPVVRDMENLINVIRENSFDYRQIQSFSAVWNRYSNGASSKHLIETLYKNDVIDMY